ncbi:MAG: GNAT family N-acetyltransferase [Cyanobacteriota bacterium]|nr:GNAT family N-acetyltransferase [Cyanobacteriota bacterium]
MLFTPPQSLSIYPATVADLPELAEVLAQAFHPPRGLQKLLFPIRKIGIREDLKQRFSSRHLHYCCLAAWQGNQIIGTLEISLRYLSWMAGRGQLPYISNLAVLPEWQRQGVGRQLLLSAEGVVQVWGYRSLYLHVLSNNHAAYGLYQQLHYRSLLQIRHAWCWLGFPTQTLLVKHLP